MNKQYAFLADYVHSFEECGNYIYSLSRREMLKIAHGLNLKAMAWKGFNDHYIKGCEFEPADNVSNVFRQIQNEIKKKDSKCGLSQLFHDWDLITVGFFKQEVSSDLKVNMEAIGYHFSNVLRNPYID